MKNILRIILLIVALLFTFALARNHVAWAATPAGSQEQSISAAAELTGSDECESDNVKDKKPCDPDKDPDKHRHRCKKKPCGTVKPPKDPIKVCEKGAYSVGGAATVEIQNLKDRECLEANTRPVDPKVDKPPKGSTIVSNVLVVMMPASKPNVTMCFAVPPGEQANIYSANQGTWDFVETNVKDGIACAEVANSGSFALIAQ